MNKEERKMKPNEWLDGTSDKGRMFLSKLDFYDKYYFETLAIHLTDFLKNTPVPILTSWDVKHKRIYFSIGKESIYFPVNTEIIYKDYLAQVERWAYQYYPQYKVSVEREVNLSDEEIFAKVKHEKYNLNDAMSLTKTIQEEEYGIIERIYILEDKFKFNVNGVYSIRISGIPTKNILPLSAFLKELRQLKKDKEIKDYIYNNSFEISILHITNEIEQIDYPGMQMMNFFKINLPDLIGNPIDKISRDEIAWGKYKIKFDSDRLRDDCMKYAKDNGVVIN